MSFFAWLSNMCFLVPVWLPTTLSAAAIAIIYGGYTVRPPLGTSDADYRMEQMSGLQLLLATMRIATRWFLIAWNSSFPIGCLYCGGVMFMLIFCLMFSLMTVQEGVRTWARVGRRVLLCFFLTLALRLVSESYFQYTPAWGLGYMVLGYCMWIYGNWVNPNNNRENLWWY